MNFQTSKNIAGLEDEDPGHQGDLDLGEEGLADAGPDQQYLATANLAQRQRQPGEQVVGENVGQRAPQRHRDNRPHQPRTQLAQMLEQRHADLLRSGRRIGGGLLAGHRQWCGLWFVVRRQGARGMLGRLGLRGRRGRRRKLRRRLMLRGCRRMRGQRVRVRMLRG